MMLSSATEATIHGLLVLQQKSETLLVCPLCTNCSPSTCQRPRTAANTHAANTRLMNARVHIAQS